MVAYLESAISQRGADFAARSCTALDFLDTVIAIVDPTGGSRRWAIAVPEPTVGVVF